MPGGDGTGPMGMGAMTGRAAGYCAGYSVPGFMNPIPGRGYWGWGMRGGGRGRRNWFYATGLPGWQRAAYGYPASGRVPSYAAPWGSPYGPSPTQEQELEALRNEAEYLEEALQEVKKRVTELESEE